MRYVEFRDAIQEALFDHPTGLTWSELKKKLDLPYDRPCPSWLKRLESEINLSRNPGNGRAYVWTIAEK